MYLSVTQNRVQRSNASMANLNSMNILTIKMLRMILQYGKKTKFDGKQFFYHRKYFNSYPLLQINVLGLN